MKCIFLDRDGVINKLVLRQDGRYTAPWNVEEFEFFPNVIETVKYFKELGYLIVVITNQPGIHELYMNQISLERINALLFEKLNIDDIYCALDRKSLYYKPGNAAFELMIKKYYIDRSKSFIIGDRWKDIVPGKNSQLNTIFLGEKYEMPYKLSSRYNPDYQIKNIQEAVNIIEKHNGS